jgi:hypothetical protein
MNFSGRVEKPIPEKFITLKFAPLTREVQKKYKAELWTFFLN